MTASKTTELRSYLQVRVSGLESQKGFGQTNLFAGYQPYMSNGGTVPQLASPIPLADVSDTSFDLTGELEAEIDLHSLGTEPAVQLPPLPRGPALELQPGGPPRVTGGPPPERNEAWRNRPPQQYAAAPTTASATRFDRPMMPVTGQPRRTLALHNSDPYSAMVQRRSSRSPPRASSATVSASVALVSAVESRRFQRRSAEGESIPHDQVRDLRAQLAMQGQQMTSFYEQARQSAAAMSHAETTIASQQAAQVQGIIADFQSELARSQNSALHQVEQYKEQLRSEMQQELQASVQTVAAQARSHVDHIELAASNAASLAATHARAQVDYLESAAAQRIASVQQHASASEAAASSMVQMARSSTASVDQIATEAYLKLEQQRTRESDELRGLIKSMDEGNRQKDQQIAQLTQMMQKMALSIEQGRDSRRSAEPPKSGQGVPGGSSGGQGDLPREEAQYRQKSPQRFDIGSQLGEWEREPQLSRPKEAESIKLHALPNAAGFRQWKQHLRDEVVGASGFPDQAFAWINRTETLSFEELADSQEFSTLDAKLAAAFSRIASGEVATRKLCLRRNAWP